jgi:hypothetical protein
MMAVKLHEAGYLHAQELARDGKVELDDRDDWSEHRPTAEQENRYIAEYGIITFGRWHLGIDDEIGADRKGHYKFPYGDFAKLHRCAVLSAESRAAQYKHHDIERAAAHLHGMLEALR